MSKKVTMQDISDIVGVSKVTVSKVFNNRNDISDEVKEKVLKVADELGYRYNPGVKTLKTGITNNIGVLVSELFLEKDENFYVNIFKHLYQAAEENQYNLFLSVVRKSQLKVLELPNICKEQKADGFVILGELPEEYIQEMMKYDLPIVLVDFTMRDLELDSIVTNNFEASYMATNYLISKGHREIGFVGNMKMTKSIMDRYLGFCKAMFEYDLEVKEKYMIKERDDEKNEIDYKLGDDLPTAFICNNDKAAYDLIKKLQANGKSVPGTCSVIGFDDVTHSIFSEPKITTMRVRKDTMADYAISRIIAKLKDKEISTEKISIDADLIERESVRGLSV
ncbi:substrate-binding domain-containing protein [Alkalihalobacillus sp. 1P02AB]|uniref:substrate-binding domain-containing protein n=1 Tax=Alkalihalobacillus sp. 1P02AB TaxID=3132260 RepID=UPI0039A72ACD